MAACSWIEPFEGPSSHSLELIPYRIRYALDHIGLKLSLSQWQILDLAERKNLLSLSHSTENDWGAFKALLLNLIENYGWTLKPCATIHSDDYLNIPSELNELLTHEQQTSISESQWALLNPYQRYILKKITLGKRFLELKEALKTYSLL
jgi:hypothetical protein